MPETLRASIKCPYCQSDLAMTLNKWQHCKKCGNDLMLSSPEKQKSDVGCLFALMVPFLLLLLGLAFLIFQS